MSNLSHLETPNITRTTWIFTVSILNLSHTTPETTLLRARSDTARLLVRSRFADIEDQDWDKGRSRKHIYLFA